MDDESVKRTAWVTKSFNEPDLVYASRYYKRYKDRIKHLNRAYPAIVRCGDVKKPAVFIKVHRIAIEAIEESAVIREIHWQALKLDAYAVLRIQFELLDPDGRPLQTITVAVGRNPTLVNLDLFLDVDDPASVDWLMVWLSWPTLMYIFVIEGQPTIAGYLQGAMPKKMKELIIDAFVETRIFLNEIPVENRNFHLAVEELR